MAEKKETNRLFGMIGLAARAGKVKSGEFAAEESIKTGKAKLCILACDASEGTRKHFTDMCTTRNVPMRDIGLTREALGHIIGRGDRSSVTIEDAGFVKNILGIIEGGNACGE